MEIMDVLGRVISPEAIGELITLLGAKFMETTELLTGGIQAFLDIIVK